jgi:vitamin B12 transporter
VDSFEGRLKNAVTLYGNQTNRSYNDISFLDFGFGLFREWDRYGYVGKRFGVEYQGDLKLGLWQADLRRQNRGGEADDPHLADRDRSFNVPARDTARQQTRSLFALYQLPIGERLDLSFGGRVDDPPPAPTAF